MTISESWMVGRVALCPDMVLVTGCSSSLCFLWELITNTTIYIIIQFSKYDHFFGRLDGMSVGWSVWRSDFIPKSAGSYLLLLEHLFNSDQMTKYNLILNFLINGQSWIKRFWTIIGSVTSVWPLLSVLWLVGRSVIIS